MQRIILASASAQRKSLLSSLNLDFEVIPAKIDEKSIRDADFKKQAEKIARSKAEAVAEKNEGIIIAANSFTVCKGKILEKPKDLEEASAMLRLQSGNKGKYYTGFCYLDRKNNISFSTALEMEFAFRKLSEAEIKTYVTKFPVTDWAAGYSPAYLYPMTTISYCKGSLTGFTHGFPMELVIEYLRKSGVEVGPA